MCGGGGVEEGKKQIYRSLIMDLMCVFCAAGLLR